jgi:hypothetical protein
MLIREIKPDDAGCFINLIKKVESESEFMLPTTLKILNDLASQSLGEDVINSFNK